MKNAYKDFIIFNGHNTGISYVLLLNRNLYL